MKCELAQRNIVQYIYGELSDEDCHDLEQHVSSCEACHSELRAYEALRHAMSFPPVEEPSPNFLTHSRVRLEEALDQLPSASLVMRLETGFFGFLAQLRAAPGMAVALGVLGLGIGATAGHYWKRVVPLQSIAQPIAQLAPPATTTVAPAAFNVSGIVQHPNTNMVEVHFNQVVPATVEGSMDDPEVQKLLLMATQNAVDPDVQSDSVDLLAAQCKAGHSCEGGPVRTALMVALRYDHNSAVRLKALEGLQPYIAQDVHVRDVILESLMQDPSPLVRSRALQMLEPVGADSSVRLVLQALAAQDDNLQMHAAYLKVLQSLPPTQ